MSFISSFGREFREFAIKGNVLDLAVGVIIGAAFGKIVSSLVSDLFMPILGMLTGGVNFSSLAVQVGDASLAYGKFLQTVLDFTIIAFAIFLVIKAANSFKRREEAKIPAPSREEQLLTEIRDLLKQRAA